MMWVKPSSDPSRAIVIDPTTGLRIPAAGIEVPDMSFDHLRMIDQGDLVRFTPPPTSGGVTSGGTVISGGSGSGGGVVTSGGTVSSGGTTSSGGATP